MEIKAMRWRDFAKYPVEEQMEYLDDIKMIYRATRKNIIDMLGIESKAFERYCRNNNMRVKWLYGKKRAQDCAQSPVWNAFVKSLYGEYGISLPRKDCFAYIEGDGRKTYKKCRALKKFYCVDGNCPFFRDRDEYAAEGRKLYGNPECIDHAYEKKISESYGTIYRGWR